MSPDWYEQHYRALYENLRSGFAHCRMISDQDQTLDFIYLEVNKAFETITGIKNAVGKRATEIGPCLTDSERELHKAYARVAKTGTAERLETIMYPSNMWLRVSLYSPERDHFVAIFDDITEQKRIEMPSREDKVRFDIIASQVPMLLYQFERKPDGTYRVPYSNIRMHDIFGCFPEDVQDGIEPIKRVIHPDDRDRFSRSIEESARTVLPWRCEFRVQIPGEPVKWIVGRSTPEKMADGTMVWSGYLMDISERREVEKALQENRDFFEKIISKVPGMVFQFIRKPDGSYGLPYCNKSIRDLYECTPEDVRENFAPIYHNVCPEDRDQLSASIEESARTMTPWQCEHRVQIPGKPLTWVLGKSTPEKLADGTILWTGYEVDITDRKRIEQALEERDVLFAKLSSRVPGMLYRFARRPDGSYHVPYSSQGIRDVFGCAPEDVRDSFDPILNVIFPEDRDRIILTIEESASNLSLWMSEFRVEVPGKPLRWMLASAVPERLPDGTIVWSGYNTDITERKLAEQEKEQLHSQLLQAQKMESVGRLAGGIAHDFNNMLSVILGNTEMAMVNMERSDPTNPLSKSLQDILNAGRRSADLTRQLLTFARKQIAAPKVLDMNDTVSVMLKMLRRLIGEDIELGWFPGHNLWNVKIDPSQVDQLLANLMVNARDAIDGAGKIAIETSHTVLDESECAHRPECIPGEYVVLAVSDNGCGMDKDTLANIFEPFFTTKKEGQGTGLGLATVYGIVKQNNGFIYVYSEPGQGTTFRIYLPRYRGESDQALVEKPEMKPPGGTETVLIVEDEQSVLNLAKAMLESLGYHVLSAGKAEEAIRLVGQYGEKIDLLLTDVVMPDMNGKELSERIVALCPGLKCLYMSGYTAEVISRQGVLEEGVHFITKPFSLKELAAKVRELLGP